MRIPKLLSFILVTTLMLGLVLVAPGLSAQATAEPKNIVNIGVTNTVNTLNPLLFDGSIVNTQALSLQFLPLVAVGAEMDFQGQIASEITTDDNLTFRITLDERATWSDGKPITTDDVIFTILRQTSQGVGNVNVYGYSFFEGFDEGGQVADDATLEDIPSIEKIDDHHFTMTSTKLLPLSTFLNNFCSYIFVIPEHIYGEMSAEELKTSTLFNQPEVVSGPYRAYDASLDHYVSYEANANYWKGAPKIEKLNLKVLPGAGLYTGLQAGEIDLIQPTMGTIPIEDQESVQELEGYETFYDGPLTNNIFFINTQSLPEVKLRQAILHGIDRQLLIDGFLLGQGEIADGFISSFSPYFHADIEPAAYDPELAKSLVEESGWDTDRELNLLTNSGDPIFAHAVNVVTQQLAELGIKTKVQTMDLNSLMAAANNHEFDLLVVQYTILPADPIMDIQFLADYTDESTNWSQYESEAMHQAIRDVLDVADDDLEGATEAYGQITRLLQDDVPFLSLYFQKPMGVVSEHLQHCVPSSYGCFFNVQEWEFDE